MRLPCGAGGASWETFSRKAVCARQCLRGGVQTVTVGLLWLWFCTALQLKSKTGRPQDGGRQPWWSLWGGQEGT